MEALDPRQLPVRLELAPAESGLGFVLRALRANGIAFDRGMHWLGLQRHRPLDRQSVRQLAWALNVDPGQLGERLVTREPGASSWIRLAGHRFRRQVATTTLYAKLCPLCVRETGFARLSWLLRPTVGCARHGYSLIWSCQHCGEAIGWDRPAVDICRCGRPFKASNEADPLEPDVHAWIEWLERGLSAGPQPRVDDVTASRLPSALTHLSVDGAFRIVEALGLCAEPSMSVRAARTKATIPRALGEVMARGLVRLKEIEADPGDVQRFALVAHQVALADVAKDFAALEDQALAWWLLNGMRSAAEAGTTRAGRRPKGQLPLFLS